MSHLKLEDPEQYAQFWRNQHSRWITHPRQLRQIVEKIGFPDADFGQKIESGNSTEVYKLTEPGTEEVLGYLRIVHDVGLNLCEIALMQACLRNELPSVDLLDYFPVSVKNGDTEKMNGVTFVAAAQGVNLLEFINEYPGDPGGSALIRNAVQSAGIMLAKMHSLAETDLVLAEVIRLQGVSTERIDIQRNIATTLTNLAAYPQSLEKARVVSDACPQLEKEIQRLREKYPLVIVDADFDPKHIYIYSETGDIESVIDFGAAHVDMPHIDFVHWKTFCPSTYDDFLASYLKERFGQDVDAANEFTDEIDYAMAGYHLWLTAVRINDLMFLEANGHLALCEQACASIAARSRGTDENQVPLR